MSCHIGSQLDTSIIYIKTQCSSLNVFMIKMECFQFSLREISSFSSQLSRDGYGVNYHILLLISSAFILHEILNSCIYFTMQMYFSLIVIDFTLSYMSSNFPILLGLASNFHEMVFLVIQAEFFSGTEADWRLRQKLGSLTANFAIEVEAYAVAVVDGIKLACQLNLESV